MACDEYSEGKEAEQLGADWPDVLCVVLRCFQLITQSYRSLTADANELLTISLLTKRSVNIRLVLTAKM